MSELLYKNIVVKLNANWQGFETLTLRDAITFLCSEANGEKPGFAIDYETTHDENGDPVLTYAQPVPWDEWVKLPVRPGDLFVNTSHGPIRAPLVVICARYNKIPLKAPRLSQAAIWERDGAVCQYTGEKVTRATANIDHVIPLDRGGKDEWTNLVVAKKEINSKKGNRLNSEVGLKLIKKPEAPKPRAQVLTAKEAAHPSQKPFLI